MHKAKLLPFIALLFFHNIFGMVEIDFFLRGCWHAVSEVSCGMETKKRKVEKNILRQISGEELDESQDEFEEDGIFDPESVVAIVDIVATTQTRMRIEEP